jgi:hypothetical protein
MTSNTKKCGKRGRADDVVEREFEPAIKKMFREVLVSSPPTSTSEMDLGDTMVQTYMKEVARRRKMMSLLSSLGVDQVTGLTHPQVWRIRSFITTHFPTEWRMEWDRLPSDRVLDELITAAELCVISGQDPISLLPLALASALCSLSAGIDCPHATNTTVVSLQMLLIPYVCLS